MGIHLTNNVFLFSNREYRQRRADPRQDRVTKGPWFPKFLLSQIILFLGFPRRIHYLECNLGF